MIATAVETSIHIRPVTPADAGEWARMRRDLWPDHGAQEHEREIRGFFGGDRRSTIHVLVAQRPSAGLAGFIEMSERSYVNECTSSPVAYVEGLFVDEDNRRRGVARAMLAAAEAWARGRGHSEMGSDCIVTNDASLAFHRSVGFEETDRVINLRKPLADPPRTPARLDMLGLFVADLPRMVAFYRDVVGLTIGPWSPPYAEFVHHGIRFSMFERAHVPELLGQTPDYPRPGKLNGSFELALRVHDADDVDREFGRMTAAGAQAVTSPRDEPWGMRSAYVADPEGNLIEIAGPPKGEG